MAASSLDEQHTGAPPRVPAAWQMTLAGPVDTYTNLERTASV